MGKKVHKELKKLTPEKEESKVGLYLQGASTLLTIIFALSYFVNKQFLTYLQGSFVLTMFTMAYNNYKVYKRKFVTIFYISVGLVVLGILVFNVLGG